MRKLIQLKALYLLAFTIISCQGTDILDDAIVEPKFEINKTQAVLRVNEETTVTAKYFDEYGVEKIVPFTWASTQPQNVSVTSSGKITALKAGSSQVFPQYQNFTGPSLEVNVVASDNAVARVTITSSKTSLSLNEQLTLTVGATNIGGQVVTGTITQWFSENESIVRVDATGKITALANGVAAIHAKIDGVKSNSINFTVGSNALVGSFIAAGGYKAVGNATLTNNNGQIILQLSNNFETSFALGTFIYLANSTNGATVRSSGLELGEIRSNGAHTFNVSQVRQGVTLSDYKFVIILCKPASLTFGFAELK